MKNLLVKKAFWQSLLSVITLGVFVLLASGSLGTIFDLITIQLDDGRYQTRELLNEYGDEQIITGYQNQYGQWAGMTSITGPAHNGGTWTETVFMVDGKRHGRAVTTFSEHSNVVNEEYNMGVCTKHTMSKSIHNSEADISAFQILGNKYPWFLLKLNVFGFDTAYVMSYLAALETKLSTNVYDITKFSDYYGDAVDELEETPFDSIITFNSQLTMFQGLAAIKNAEFRLAVIDRYLSAGSSTFNTINNTYPGYLLTLKAKGINNEDFKFFCQDMDSRMTSYGTLNIKDPFFIDSVDARMYRAVIAIMDAGKSFSFSAEQSVINLPQLNKGFDINDIYDEVLQMLKTSFSKSTPKEVGNVVVMHMLEEYYIPAEIIRQAVMEAYLIKGGVKRVPTATTVFERNNSTTSVSLTGYIIEDGGAAVTSRGIAWATFYNPTTNDNKAAQGTGTGSFPATLTGLTYGTTYYARTYATNSAGTAYGNCISFNTNITTDINDIKSFAQHFTVYPNPASSSVTLSFQLETPGKIQLTLIDMKGQIVLQREPGSFPQGENVIYLDISALQNGLYTCILTNGVTRVMQKLLIAR